MSSVARVKQVRYKLAGRQVKKGTPGAERVEELSRKYYGSGVPGWPAGKRVPLAADRASAERMLDDLVRRAERGKAGLPDRDALRRPLAALVPEFEGDVLLGLAGKVKRMPTAKQARLVANRVAAALADGCGLRAAEDLDAQAPAKLARLVRAKLALPRAGGGWSHQTADFHLAACARFARWLAARGVPVDPALFDAVPGADPTNNRVHARRDASPEELVRLLDTARAGPPRRGLSGEERYTLYLVAFSTGFRALELSGLTTASFRDLAGEFPAVALPGRQAKNKDRVAAHPLPRGVARHLATFLAGRPAGRPVWPPGRWSTEGAKLLRRDLRDAGVPYTLDTPDGEKFLDFHALRHSYVSMLAASGEVGPKELQVLARHKTSKLTLDVYTHARAGRVRGGVEALALPGHGAAGPTAEQELQLLVILAAIGAALAGLDQRSKEPPV